MVLCQPLAEEYILSHRSMRRLAELLSRAGIPTLRFDYFGCGDSPGELTEARFDRWLLDVEAATGELLERSGCTRICIVGLRLGGNLALSRGLTDSRIESVVLWDPVVDMNRHLESVLEATGGARPVDGFAMGGFEVAPALVEELQRMDILARADTGQARVLLVETEATSSASALASRLEAAGSTVERRSQAGASVWQQDINRVVVPLKLLQFIVAWVSHQSA